MVRKVPISKSSETQNVIDLSILSWVKSVIDIIDHPPIFNNIGDRYIIYTTDMNNEWYQYNNYVIEWNGNTWEKNAPVAGWALYVKNRDDYYFFNSENWEKIDHIIEHNDLNQIQGGNQTERYHLTKQEHDKLTLGQDATNLHHHDSRYQTKILNTTQFDSILDSNDNTVQKALDTIDNFVEWDPDLNSYKIKLKK